MQGFILSGSAVDLVLIVILIEFGVLVARRRRDRRRAVVDLFFALMPGAILLLALRFALVGADWRLIAISIAASFPFHLIDLRRRARAR